MNYELMLARFEPYAFKFYRSRRIVRVDDDDFVASTDGRTIWLGEKFFKANEFGRFFYALHEVLHGILNHPYRFSVFGDRYRRDLNKCADGIINYRIIEAYPMARKYLKDWTTVFEKRDLELLSLEMLVSKYYGLLPTEDSVLGYDLMKGDYLDAGSVGVEGFKGNVLRKFGRVGTEYVPYEDILKMLVSFVNDTIYIADTFGLPRILTGLPAKRKFGTDKISFLVDVSGSIDGEMLEKFGRILKVVENAEYIYFDYDVRGKSMVPMEYVEGGGSTRLLPALREASGTNIVVISDGKWKDEDEVKKYMKENSDKVYVLVSPFGSKEGFLYHFQI